ncbi:MAG: hypothetical protein NC299_02485 [Lachnospiraceae bacterium]|nr:hypothetical protein [Ruminococcus sp.]MCM1274217.1 hypothetical protein [Lachnospiraceae bacterium]
MSAVRGGYNEEKAVLGMSAEELEEEIDRLAGDFDEERCRLPIPRSSRGRLGKTGIRFLLSERNKYYDEQMSAVRGGYNEEKAVLEMSDEELEEELDRLAGGYGEERCRLRIIEDITEELLPKLYKTMNREPLFAVSIDGWGALSLVGKE